MAALAVALVIAVVVLRVVTPAAAPAEASGRRHLEDIEHDLKTAFRERALHPDLESVLFSEAEIAAAIRSLAQQIARDHVGEDVLLLGVLKGAVHVLSDLARELDGIQPGPSRLFPRPDGRFELRQRQPVLGRGAAYSGHDARRSRAGAWSS